MFKETSVTTCRLTTCNIVNVILLFQLPPYSHGAGMCFGCKILTFSSSPSVNLRISRWWMWRWRYSQTTITHTRTMGDRKCYQWDKIIWQQSWKSINKVALSENLDLKCFNEGSILNVLKKPEYYKFKKSKCYIFTF